MIKLSNCKVSIKDEINISELISKKLKINTNDILSYRINKKSIDARHKPNIVYVYEFYIEVKDEAKVLNKNINNVTSIKEEHYINPSIGNEQLSNRPVIIGSGPSGLFCALLLAECGYKPLIVERGKPIEERIKDVDSFWEENKLNKNSNVCFGEGGAGTFSDGKLNTLVKDKYHRMEKVFEIFVSCGADPSILYEHKPHIGTDILRNVIINLRKKIIKLGGEFLYENVLTDIIYEDNKVKKIVLNNNKEILCDALVLAIGHSARDTFKMLYDKKLDMIAKPFAVGVRVQHNQEDISFAQYGEDYKLLPPADYKLTYQSKSGRGVYSFCMCPGGYVVNSSTEDNGIVINGMSYQQRDSKNANSAIIVTVSPNDFGTNPLDGIKFQKELEEKTYIVGEGNIPTQTLKDFLDNKETTKIKNISPVMKGNYKLTNLNSIFPDYINDSLKESFEYFGNKINGFNNPDTLLSAIESRTSSPVRITRDENYESNIKGIYPCGEGSGYAGGITTSAVDGIKVAEAIIKKFKYER